MRRDIKKYVESELRFYLDTKKEFEAIRSDIIDSSGGGDSEGSRGSRGGSVTEHKAMKLRTNKRLNKMEETLNAISRQVDSLNPTQKRFVELYYWQNKYTLGGIACELCVGERTVYRWRNNLCKGIATDLGLID